MRCGLSSYAVVDPYRTVRQDFERKTGLAATGPSVDLTISESESGFDVMIDVPGVHEESISVKVENGHLTIEGERNSQCDENAKVVFSNRVFGGFRRVLKLDDTIDSESIDAVLDHGVLTIHLNRRPEVKPQKITVRHQDS